VTGTLVPMRWNVREDGNRVIVEFICRDNYEAIELGEIIALGMSEGEITFEFEDTEGDPSDGGKL
jgi:hypothetical protein